MSSVDRGNLEFILSSVDEDLREWFDSLDEDERNYAFSLLERAKIELSLRTVELLDKADNEEIDCSESEELLKKFRK